MNEDLQKRKTTQAENEAEPRLLLSERVRNVLRQKNIRGARRNLTSPGSSGSFVFITANTRARWGKKRFENLTRAKRPRRLPTVLSQDETLRLIGMVKGTYQLGFPAMFDGIVSKSQLR